MPLTQFELVKMCRKKSKMGILEYLIEYIETHYE